MRSSLVIGVLLCALAGSSCSVKKYAIRKVGDSLNSGPSTFETDNDIELVGDALPFSLKFVETLLAEVPDDPDLLLTACRGFVLYSYAYVDFEAEKILETDLDEGRRRRARARRLYVRGMGYGLKGLERLYPGFEGKLKSDPKAAVAMLNPNRSARDVPFLYWTAAALGLAISVSKDDATMLSRIPEVEAILNRAIELDSDWDSGSLHAFAVTFEGAKPTGGSRETIDKSFRTAEQMSGGNDAGLYVAYAENVAIPEQDAVLFREMLGKALAINPDVAPARRLANLIAQRRAQWLLDRIGDLFLIVPETTETRGGR